MRLVSLDILRFLAAFAVVLYHYTARAEANSFPDLAAFTKFGYLGVPLFFMISGYVIALSAYNRTPYEFAVSRFTRLYPAFWVSILITCIVTIYFAQERYTATQILANLTMLNDYLGIDNIDGVYWTLQVELKFYACIFILLLFGVFKYIKCWLSLWLAITICYLLFKQPFFMGWFINPHYSPLFIGGVALYLIHRDGPGTYNLVTLIISAILACYLGFNQSSAFIHNASIQDQYTASLVILGFYVLFYCLVTSKYQLKENGVFLLLGSLTYPLYLIHNAAGKAIIDFYKSTIAEWFIVLVVTACCLLVSYLIHAQIERRTAPAIKHFFLIKLRSREKLNSHSN